MRRTGRDLVDEAKKRVVLLLTCVFVLSYLMSLTSSSIWINMPAAASLIILLRYIISDLDIQRRSTAQEKLSSANNILKEKTIEFAKSHLEDSSWKSKVNCPVVETAIDHFNRHMVSEWVTDLWYSRITPDKDGPEELVQILNNVLGEISHRAKDINLINFLIRDIINLFCNHLEIFRTSLSKIKKKFAKLPDDMRDQEVRIILAAENNLHPALFSADAEHKVLQHLMDGLLSSVIKPENLRCSFFRYTARELLACVVIRPVLNLANPRIINEKVENFVLSLGKKREKNAMPSGEGASSSAPCQPSQFPFFHDSSVGVELVQVTHENLLSKGVENESKETEANNLSQDWGHVLDVISARKTQALAPDHLENMWTKGRHYEKKEIAIGLGKQNGNVATNFSRGQNGSTDIYVQAAKVKTENVGKAVASSKHVEPSLRGTRFGVSTGNVSAYPVAMPNDKKLPQFVDQEDADSESSYAMEDDDNANVTGLDSPGTRVWDSKNKAKVASQIRHPLESSSMRQTRKSTSGRVFHPRAARTSSGRKRHWPTDLQEPVLEEDTQSSCFLGDESDDSDQEVFGRESSGATASSSMSSTSASEAQSLSTMSSELFAFDYSFLQLKCEVLGANIVKSGSGTFAVYSIAVVDADGNSWSIKRRFRHFEDLHRRLKEFQEYNLRLPPKHFLSSGLEIPVIQERCKLLDRYLKNLLQLPTVSRSIEVCDFLSVDSQTYIFADSLSIVQTLSIVLDQKPYGKVEKYQNMKEDATNVLQSTRATIGNEEKILSPSANSNNEFNSFGLRKRNSHQHLTKSSGKSGSYYEDSSSSDKRLASLSAAKNPTQGMIGEATDDMSRSFPTETAIDPVPSEWVQPNLSVPIFDLVDVIFQLQDGGWIRRQAFWVVKQVLQLGMGDAFDDWLIEKIQLLRDGSLIASVINRIEQILWPDGIFITKHPNRRKPPPQTSTKEDGARKANGTGNQLTYEEQLEASRRSEFVRELIIDRAPAALVSVIGRKEYERSAKDIYYFLQSSVCLKQLAFELLELLLLAAFPELEDAVRSCHEEKEKFGSFEK